LVIHRLDGGLTSLSYRPVGGDGDENKIHIQLLVAAQNGAGRAWAAGNGMWGCAAAGRASERAGGSLSVHPFRTHRREIGATDGVDRWGDNAAAGAGRVTGARAP